MKYENPYIAELDEVTITREGNTAIIEYKKENVSGVNFKIGDKIHRMSDQDILDLHNDGIQAVSNWQKIMNILLLKFLMESLKLIILKKVGTGQRVAMYCDVILVVKKATPEWQPF